MSIKELNRKKVNIEFEAEDYDDLIKKIIDAVNIFSNNIIKTAEVKIELDIE